MRFLFKLVLLAVAIAALTPVLGPDTQIGAVVRAAFDDAGRFCERNPDACEDGAAIAADTQDLIASTLSALAPTNAETLTPDDRNLAPMTVNGPGARSGIAPETPSQTFAGHDGAGLTRAGRSGAEHNGAVHY